jgi:STE24 endopeptidase
MIFNLIIFILFAQFTFDAILEYLNSSKRSENLPGELKDIYDKKEYSRSILYEKTNRRFSLVSGAFNLVLILLMLFLGGFAHVHNLAGEFTQNEVWWSVVFFAILMLGSGILNLPFSIYHTFVIEEKFGFNKTSLKTFLLDRVKGIFLAALIGGGLLALIAWIYLLTGDWFWLYALGVITLFSLFMNFFYSTLIVPLFNRQTPLEEGELKDKIKEVSHRAGFRLDKVFVIDGSKRSAKANAYFSGLGAKKRIVLFDTLLNDLSVDEIVAVLTHEIGHYRKKHIYKGMIISLFTTAFTLWLFSQFAGSYELSAALGVAKPAFHMALVAFGILYSPISMLLGLGGNYLSRKHEFQADAFAAKHFEAEHLSNALKKLSVKNLCNLQPHPLYVFFNYSHPPLLDRLKALQKQ